MQLAHADFSCIMVELLFLLPSARCIQTVSSQIERLQLRAPETTPFFCNNVKVFSHSTFRWFGSRCYCFDSNVILKYCIDASSYCKSHKKDFLWMHQNRFYDNARGFLVAFILTAFQIYVSKFLYHYYWSICTVVSITFLKINWCFLIFPCVILWSIAQKTCILKLYCI